MVLIIARTHSLQSLNLVHGIEIDIGGFIGPSYALIGNIFAGDPKRRLACGKSAGISTDKRPCDL